MKPPFQFHLGPWPAVAVSPIAIFGSHHVTKDFTTAQVKTAAGELYIPGEQKFFRYLRADGTLAEESGYDFNFKYRVETSGGGEMCFTHREIPRECVVKAFFKPEVGKLVQIDGLVSGSRTARILAFGNGYLQTDWPPQYGDSGSLCWGEDGSFAGAVTSGVRADNGAFTGSIISTPPQVGDPMLEGTIAYAPGTWPGSTSPAPTPAPETPAAPMPVSAPPAPVSTPPEPPLSSVVYKTKTMPIGVSTFDIIAVGDSLVATTNDGSLYCLRKLKGEWERLPALPAQ